LHARYDVRKWRRQCDEKWSKEEKLSRVLLHLIKILNFDITIGGSFGETLILAEKG
jgi:hypothetical protein